MQDVFDLNTIIDNLKRTVNLNYNFQSSNNELETRILLFDHYKGFPVDIQNRYAKFNEQVKELANQMISELEEQRDSMMLKILSNKNKGEEPSDE